MQDILEKLNRLENFYCDQLQDQEKRINELESLYNSEYDLSAIHGQIKTILKNDKHSDFQIERLEKIVLDLEERLKKIESSQLAHELDPKVWKFVSDRLDKLESTQLENRMHESSILMRLKTLEAKWGNPLIERMDKLEKQVSNWEEEFYFIQGKVRDRDKRPYKCPVCEGKGKINLVLPAGGYWENNCNSCKGDGIVWG